MALIGSWWADHTGANRNRNENKRLVAPYGAYLMPHAGSLLSRPPLNYHAGWSREAVQGGCAEAAAQGWIGQGAQGARHFWVLPQLGPPACPISETWLQLSVVIQSTFFSGHRPCEGVVVLLCILWLCPRCTHHDSWSTGGNSQAIANRLADK